MKPEQQRIAIAEICGFVKNTNTAFGKTAPWWYNPAGQIFWESELPDYLNDLNAMHEAEKVLDEKQQQEYVNLLLTGDSLNYFAEIHATATQRAEAFLRTLNLWTP